MINIKFTENVGILEVDLCVSDGVGGVKQNLTFSVEFDAVSGFIDSVCRFDEGQVGDSCGFDSDVLLVHVLDVVDIIAWLEGLSSESQWQQSFAQHFQYINFYNISSTRYHQIKSSQIYLLHLNLYLFFIEMNSIK